MGLEPTNGGTTIHCLNLLATPAIFKVLYHYNTLIEDGKTRAKKFETRKLLT